MADLAISTMPFLDTLAGIRTGFMTAVFNVLTFLGDEKLFVVISLIVIWCFSKQGGRYMLTVGFGASGIGQTLKMLFRIPRPWELGEEPFQHTDPTARGTGADRSGGLIGKLLGSGADGWSFPSGHTLISVGTYGAMAAWFRQKWIRIAGIALAVLIPFTRLYLGVHTPLDILGGTLISLALVLALKPFFAGDRPNRVRAVLIGNIVLNAALLLWMSLATPANLEGEDIAKYLSGLKNLWQLVGATLAVEIAYEVDERVLHYDVKAVWWAQVLKIIGGSVIVLGVQLTVQKVLGYSSSALTMENITRMGIIAALANLLSMLAGMVCWPMTFRWFAKLGKEKVQTDAD